MNKLMKKEKDLPLNDIQAFEQVNVIGKRNITYFIKIYSLYYRYVAKE